MAREIHGTLYRIRSYSRVPRHVECENLDDLYRFVAEMVVKGHAITSVNRIDDDGTTPRIPVLSNKMFKKMYKELLEGQK